MNLERTVRRLQRSMMAQCLLFVSTLIALAMLFASSILSMRKDLTKRMDEIEKNHEIFTHQLNVTIQDFNNTVGKVQEDVEQTVQEMNDNVSSQNYFLAYQFAGTFAVLGSLISFWHMSSHLRNFHAPSVQRKIIAILWMIPIYSVSSWLSLVFVHAEAFLGLFKDIYEAYCIYCFLSFLISIMGRGDRDAAIDCLAKHADHLHPPIQMPWAPDPVFQSPRQKAEAVLNQCQVFSMQFVFLRPITTIATIIADEYHESRWDPAYPQIYISIVTNVSIFIAFFGLLKFYHVVKDDLNWCHPFSKFMSIKAVVFMTFWQGVAISFIAHAVFQRNDDSNSSQDATEWSKQAQSFMICLEMFAFAIVHCFVFPAEEWEPGYREREKKRIKATFGDSLALKDFVADVKTVMRSRKVKYSKINKKKSPSTRTACAHEEKGSTDIDKQSPTTSLVLDNSHDQFEIGDDDEEEDNVDWSQKWTQIQEFIDEIDEVAGTQTNNLNTNASTQGPREVV